MTAKNKRRWVFLFLGLALVALILLTAGLPGLKFQPGQNFSLGRKQPSEPTTMGAAANIDLSPALYALFFAILGLFGVTIVYLILSPEARKRVLWRFLPLLLMLGALLLARQRAQPAPTAVPQQTASALIEPLQTPGPPELIAEFNPKPPQWLVWGTFAWIALAVALGVGGLVWLLWRRDLKPPGVLQELGEQAQSAVSALEGGADPKDIILRCYFEMSRTVSRERGLERWTAMTPREFEQRLVGAGLPRVPVQRLTRLFEQVRYGAWRSGEREEQEAVACLAAIAQACQESSAHDERATHDLLESERPEVSSSGTAAPRAWSKP